VTKAWLKDVDWELIIDINKGLCTPKKALHRATSDGYEETKKLWEEGMRKRWGSARRLNFAGGVTGWRLSATITEILSLPLFET
jgi:hypothetical protein